MFCCDNVVKYGCSDTCSDFFFQPFINAPLDGTYTFRGYFVNGTFFQFAVDFLAGDPLYIPANTMNESKEQSFFIFAPDFTPIEFAPDVFCANIKPLIPVTLTVPVAP